jgi:hypothetical protein
LLKKIEGFFKLCVWEDGIEVPGSKAIYEKQIDATGKTTQFTKTTIDPQGNVVHVKDKITTPETVITPTKKN